MAWLVAAVMAASAAAMGILFARVERVRIQPSPEPDPTHNRRRGDRAASV